MSGQGGQRDGGPGGKPGGGGKSGDVWNPAQYERFRDERSRPFYELMALVRPQAAMRVVDLGCGTGELTRQLHQHLGAQETIGLDSSAAMLERARPLAGDGVRFVTGDIAAFAGLAHEAGKAEAAGSAGADAGEAPQQAGARRGEAGGGEGASGTFDLVFSNAALQWVDGHVALLEGLTARLRPGGQLAVQVPANNDHPSHVVASEVASEEPFRTALGGYVRRFPILDVAGYASLLDRLGYQEQHVRLQVFGHHLASREEVVEWVKGTLLTDYQKRLEPALYEQFLKRYRERLRPRLEDTRPYFYGFQRILLWGRDPTRQAQAPG